MPMIVVLLLLLLVLSSRLTGFKGLNVEPKVVDQSDIEKKDVMPFSLVVLRSNGSNKTTIFDNFFSTFSLNPSITGQIIT